jgi:YggT family protein
MNVFVALAASLIELLSVVLDLFVWVLIVSAVLSWLVAFDIVNPRQKLVAMIGAFTYRVTEPVLRPIRRYLPAMGGLDLSPLVLILLLMFLQSFLRRLVFGA